MEDFDNKGIGWIIAGVVIQWIVMLLLLFSVGAIGGTAGGLLVFLLILGLVEVSICTYGVVQLNKGHIGWITFFLIYSIIGAIITIIRGAIPIGPILYLIGAIILKNNNE